MTCYCEPGYTCPACYREMETDYDEGAYIPFSGAPSPEWKPGDGCANPHHYNCNGVSSSCNY